MRILLIGGTGQLGSDVLRNGAAHEIWAPPKDVLDVARPDSVRSALRSFRPDAVLNTAAFHNVPLCETEPLQAFRINCVAVRDLAVACKEADCLFVSFSTDYVFGGEKGAPYLEDDRPGPLQVYGISKLAGEYAALSTAPCHSVMVRTCGLYGATGARSKGGNFVDQRISDSRRGVAVEISCEQIVSPTWAGDLAGAVLRLVSHPQIRPGVYHLVNEGQCSWFDFTKEIYAILRLPVEVLPIDRQGLSGTMRRPVFSALSNRKASAMGVSLPPWRVALRRYLNDRPTDTAGGNRA